MTSFLQYCVNTLGYLRLMTVSDLIDIAILSFLFYKCIGIFQRTNAAKVAKALLLIIVAATTSPESPAFSGMKPQSAMWRRPFRRRWRPMERCRKTGWAP